MLRTSLHLNLCLLLALSCLLSACGAPRTEAPSAVPAGIASDIADSQAGLPPLQTLYPEDTAFGNYIKGYYRLDPAAMEDGVVCYAGGVEAAEIAVLLFRDEKGAAEAQTAFAAYIPERAADFAGYAPEQAAVAENGRAVRRGRYAALLICPDPERAETAFRASLTGQAPPVAARTPESAEPSPAETAMPATAPPIATAPPTVTKPPAITEPPETAAPPEPTESPAITEPPEIAEPPAEGVYDREAVLAAWESGDASELSEKSRCVLEAADYFLRTLTTEEMTDYEKELAVHDWMIDWADYDIAHLSHDPDLRPDPDDDNPYGFLLHRTGICYGYANTFRLFMDLLGIECVTVEGTARETEAHAWNMVRLDGEWYCVDVTWDDPVVTGGGRVSPRQAHEYFNVTSDFLRQTDHQWDEDAVEEATGTAYSWRDPDLFSEWPPFFPSWNFSWF